MVGRRCRAALYFITRGWRGIKKPKSEPHRRRNRCDRVCAAL